MPAKTKDIFGEAAAEKSGLFQGRASARNAVARGGNIYDALLSGLTVPQLLEMTRSAEAQAAASPESVAAQNQALSQLGRLAGSPTITPSERLMLDQIEGQQMQTERGAREAILANASARGQLGGGLPLMAQLQASQAGAERARQQGLGAASMANERFLSALSGLGSLGSEARQQSFAEAMSRGGAEDARMRYNNALKAQKFGMESELAGQKANFLGGLSAQQQEMENARRQRIGNMIGNVLQLGASTATAMYNPASLLGKK